MEVLSVEHPLVIRRGVMVRPSDLILKEQGRKIGSQVTTDFPLALPMKCDLDMVPEVKQWANQVMHPVSRFRLYGCWEIVTLPVKINRNFIGISAYFRTFPDAIQFKISWCDQWAGAF